MLSLAGQSLYQMASYGQPLVPIDQPFVCRWTTPTMGHQLWVTPAQGTATADMNSFYVRVLCHWLIDRLPERAFPEVLPSLMQMHEFYAEEVAEQPLLPEARRPLKSITRTSRREIELPDED